MLKDRELAYLFIGGGIVGVIVAVLYLSIRAATHVFGFFILSGLVVSIFLVTFVQLVVVERLVDSLTALLHQSRLLLYGVAVLGLSGFILLLVNGLLFLFSLDADTLACREILMAFRENIYDPAQLNRCPALAPLAPVVPAESGQVTQAVQNLPLALTAYLDYFADEASLGLTTTLTLGTTGSLVALAVLILRICGAVLAKFLFETYGSLAAFQKDEATRRLGAARQAYQQGQRRYEQGDYSAAFAAYQTAIELDPHHPAYLNVLSRYRCVIINPAALAQLCSLLIDKVPPASEGAVYDLRAITRALSGDLAGAARDVVYFISWAETRGLSPALIAQRRTWLAALKQGQNPFDPETLAQILPD